MNYNKSRLEKKYDLGKFKQFDTVKVITKDGIKKGILCSYVLSKDDEGRASGYDCVLLIRKKTELYYITSRDEIKNMYPTKHVLIEKDIVSNPMKIIDEKTTEIREAINNVDDYFNYYRNRL